MRKNRCDCLAGKTQRRGLAIEASSVPADEALRAHLRGIDRKVVKTGTVASVPVDEALQAHLRGLHRCGMACTGAHEFQQQLPFPR